MAKIRYLNFLDFYNVKKLASRYTEEDLFNFSTVLLSQPIALINYFMPVSLKFYSDYYAAVNDGKLKGMLSIKPKRNNNCKWKITKLLLDKNSYETGEQLIDYVVAKYGAKGVETIEVNINSKEEDMLDLFSKACGFRYCLDYRLYKINKNFFNGSGTSGNCILRPFKPADITTVTDLYNQNILPYYKFPLSKTKKEFEDDLFKGLCKNTTFKYILEDKYSKQIRGYLKIETDNNLNYVIETVFLESYENYFTDTMNFAISQISKRSKESNIFFRNSIFHSNSKEMENIMKKSESELIQTEMIFVKDFFRQIKESEKLSKPAIIFNDINGKPVYKI